jgi:hypothetical protein
MTADLIIKGVNMLLSDLLFVHYKFDSDSKEIFGCKVRVDKIYYALQTIIKKYSEADLSKENTLISKIGDLLERKC